MAQRREPAKVVVGNPLRRVLGGIDFMPSIEVEMASRSQVVHAVESGWNLVFVARDGYRTRLFPYVRPRLDQDLTPGTGYYSPWAPVVRSLTDLGFPIVGFNANQMYELARTQ